MIKKKLIKRIFQLLFITASISSLYFVPWVLVRAWISPLPSTVEEQVNKSIQKGVDGSIVYIDEFGKPPAFYAAGWHNRDKKIPANPNALFKIASIGKLYVAVAITKLVHEKRLSLDQSLAEYFPELVGRIENAETITLRMMVMHRSGIPNYTDSPGFWENPPQTIEDILELALDLPANFQPDEDYGYSNTNYLLIAKLMDQVLGYDHFQYIKEKILLPLELNHTFGSLSQTDLDQVMSGYYVGFDADLKMDEYGMLATAQDVGIFLRALNNGSIFDEGEQDIYSSIYEYNHTGWVPGYQSIAYYDKEIDTVVIQFMNSTGGYNWNLLKIINNRIFKILRKQ